ncbi:MAG: protein kinase domain-containing protein [Elusimicrobiota bacterium]
MLLICAQEYSWASSAKQSPPSLPARIEVSTSAVKPAGPEAAKNLTLRAAEEAAAGHFSQSERLASSALAADPESAAAYAQRAAAEIHLRWFRSVIRDVGRAQKLGFNDPIDSALRKQAYLELQKQASVSTDTTKSSTLASAKTSPRSAMMKIKNRPLKAAPVPIPFAFGLAVLTLAALIVLARLFLKHENPAPKKIREEPKSRPAAFSAPPLPLPKPGAMMGGRFILGSLEDDSGGLAVYDGRDLSDKPVTIVRYPAIDGGLERAKKAAGLKHPSISESRGAFAGGVYHFAVYEPSGKDTLRRIINRLPERRYSPEQILRPLKCLCEALDFAHNSGIFHGPIIPEDVVISQGQIKLRGFGLWPVGALAYAPPEFSPQTGCSSPSCDLFCLGACLYELLTGHAPFLDNHGSSGIKRPSEADSPSTRAAGIATAMDSFFSKALAHDSSQRFLSGAEFFEEFAGLVAPKSRGK